MKRENYITIQGWMVTELGLSGNELLCYALIYGFSQDDGSVFSGSSRYICKWLNLTKPSVLKILKSLCEKGLIEKIQKEVNGCILCDYKKTLPVVKKLNQGGKETLPHIYNIYNNKDNNPPLYPPFKEEGKKKDNWGDFEEFWRLYPKQRIGNKQKAYSSYLRVLKEERASVEKLLSSVKAYADSEEVKNGYAKGCQAWLNDDRFNIDYNSKQSLLEGIDWQ